MSCKISIIIPVYNVEPFLHRCLDSVLAQTYRDLQIICVNDGSPDNSLEILRDYEKRDDRIVIIDKKNGGLSSARNAALPVATGEYIAFVDSDDWIEPNMMEVLVRTLEEHDADVVNCQFDCVTVKGIHRPRPYSHTPIIANTEEALQLLLRDRQVTNHVWRNLFKRHLFSDVRFPEGKTYEDIYVMPKIFKKCSKIVFIEDALYHYYINTNGICKTKNYTNTRNFADALLWKRNIVKKEYPAFYDEYHYRMMKIFYMEANVILKDIGRYDNGKKSVCMLDRVFLCNYLYYMTHTSGYAGEIVEMKKVVIERLKDYLHTMFSLYRYRFFSHVLLGKRPYYRKRYKELKAKLK